LLARLHRPSTSCVALVAATVTDRTSPSRAAAHEGALELLRATGWDVVPAEEGEPLTTTWSRVGSGRTLATGGAR
ncbi:MAG TPA: hypothetical protein VF661_07505, partial [Actinomycetales bacterium]